MIGFDTNFLSFIKSNILDLMNWGKRKSSLPSRLVEDLSVVGIQYYISKCKWPAFKVESVSLHTLRFNIVIVLIIQQLAID